MRKLKDMKQLGQIIRQVRKDQGLTQEQLAATCGVGLRFVRDVEQGKASCHIGKVIQVVYMLGIKILIEEGGRL